MLGSDHPDVAFPLSCKGESLIGLARYDEAIEVFARALDLRVRHGNTAWTRWLLGRAQVEGGAASEEGKRNVDDALAVLVDMEPVTVNEVIEIHAWIRERNLEQH